MVLGRGEPWSLSCSSIRREDVRVRRECSPSCSHTQLDILFFVSLSLKMESFTDCMGPNREF